MLEEIAMSSSFWSIDRSTHIKIVAVSLLAASVVVAVGLSARTTGSIEQAHGPVLKAGQPSNLTANDASSVQ
jgi:hypothetical protein